MTIQQQLVSGRPATVSYLTADFEPATPAAFDVAKVVFDDSSDVAFLQGPGMAPAFPSEGTAEGHAFNRHRQQYRRPHPIADIEGDAEAVGWARHRTNHQVSLLLVLTDPEEILPDDGATDVADVPVKLQLVAWAKAIMVLDASEILIRDLIERDLDGHTGQPANVLKGMQAIPAVNRLVEKIKLIRQDAIKTAFRLLRSRLGDVTILDQSLATWAQAFARNDIETIRTAITSGLIDGLDNAEIARKVVGTLGLNGVDGVTEFTRHKIAHLGRAAIKAHNLRKNGDSLLTPE